MIEELNGERILSAKVLDCSARVLLRTENHVYEFHHEQDCCENVRLIEAEFSIEGMYSWENIPEGGLLVREASERTESKDVNDFEHETQTFYHIDTDKGAIHMRWLGESNGYYSEEVQVTAHSLDYWEEL